MTEVQAVDKVEALKELQKAIKGIDITSGDRLDIARPIMEILKNYGVTSFTFKVPFPSFNDGDPCFAYVSETFNFKADYAHVDDQTLDEVDIYNVEDCFAQYLTETGRSVDVSPKELEVILRAFYNTYELLLDLDKCPTSVKLTYTWDAAGFLSEEEESYYVY